MLKESSFVKLKINVPATHLEIVRKALGEAGAGKLGNYDYCACTYPVHGYFRPLAGAKPAIGEIGHIEEVEECCVECICHKDLIESTLEAVKKVHPYEEIAYDIIPRFDIV
ncbi:MAG: hypothetical protein HYV41_01190 [Candidatus Magasanikbacteria bacterium]|nr:hypothetical protein [Candidatus Magasanikbacteria bacterium]